MLLPLLVFAATRNSKSLMHSWLGSCTDTLPNSIWTTKSAGKTLMVLSNSIQNWMISIIAWWAENAESAKACSCQTLRICAFFRNPDLAARKLNASVLERTIHSNNFVWEPTLPTAQEPWSDVGLQVRNFWERCVIWLISQLNLIQSSADVAERVLCPMEQLATLDPDARTDLKWRHFLRPLKVWISLQIYARGSIVVNILNWEQTTEEYMATHAAVPPITL